MIFVLTLVFSGVASATTLPVFKVNDGDVFVGGWFDNGSSCSNSDPGYQSYNALQAGSDYEGAIMAFGDASTRKGASTDRAAFTLGTIEADQNANKLYGFFSGLGPGPSTLSFAAPPSGSSTSWGGYFQGAVAQTHCIPDYFSSKRNAGSSQTWDASTTVSNAFPTQYYIDSLGSVFHLDDSADQKIAAGKNLTIFVRGDVSITNNITYASHTASTVPKFALVVLGDIFIDNSVTQLDGLYIAQPNMGDADPVNDDTGIIWTCHSASTTNPDTNYIANKCRTNQLTVNGALIAKSVKFTRSSGDLGKSVAEKINYTPEMVIGGPFFNPLPDPTLNIQSIISLPPVF